MPLASLFFGFLFRSVVVSLVSGRSASAFPSAVVVSKETTERRVPRKPKEHRRFKLPPLRLERFRAGLIRPLREMGRRFAV